jgi:Mrp family chromosome partitioning ATPase
LVQSLQVGMQQTISMPAGDALEVRVLSAAEPPNRASSPKPTLAGVFGVAAGGAIGVLFSLVSTRSSLGGAAPAAIARGLPVFAVLPAFAGRGRRRLLAAIASRPTGEIADVLRTLRLRIRASAKAGAPRIVTLIPTHSTQTGALIALAFARLAAADGERVLLIEGSLQTPVLAPLLGLRLPHGLAGVLEGKPHWRDALAHDTQSSLDLLLADRGAANAQALLTSMRFQNVLTEARDDYHLIVLSAPSTEVAAGALTLANCADATVLVFDDNRHTSSDAVGRFVEDLVMTSTGPVAAMLTRAA